MGRTRDREIDTPAGRLPSAPSASTARVIGSFSARARSQPGIGSVWTKALLAKVNGKTATNIAAHISLKLIMEWSMYDEPALLPGDPREAAP
jgi:hypothetical protein